MTASSSPATTPAATTRVPGGGALFLLPFLAVGIGAGIAAMVQALHRQWAQAGFLAIFAILLGGAGVVTLLIRRRGFQTAGQRESLEALHPEEPWLWDAQWAAGRISDSSVSEAVMSGVFAVFWNLIAIPTGYLSGREVLKNGVSPALLGLIFPLVGVALAVWAARTAIRYFKFGSSTLVLETLPGVIGHEFAGSVTARVGIEPPDGFRVSLTSLRRVTTGSGKNRSTTETVLWQEERVIGTGGWRRAEGGTVIGCRFALPADATETSGRGSGNEVVWRLALTAEVPGVDYAARFEVPVFRTAESDTPLAPDEAQELAVQEDLTAYRQPADSRIRVTTSRRGLDVFFAPARNLGASVGITLFFLVWTGMVVGMVLLGVPVIFTAIFGAVDLLVLYGVITSWLGTSSVHCDRQGVRITTGLLGGGTPRLVPAADLVNIGLRVGMQSGSVVYYDLQIVTRSGERITAGKAVRDKGEAEWLASQMQGAVAGTL